MKRILLFCFTFAAVLIFFQNCSMPNTAGLSNSSIDQSSLDVEVESPIAIVSLADKIYPKERAQLVASGGVPPYQYTILDGEGSMDQSNGVYTAGNKVGSTVIQVLDSHSNAARVRVVVKAIGSYSFTPIYMSTKSSVYAYYYSDVKESMTVAPVAKYVFKGVLFNTLNIASSPKQVILCKKVISSTLNDYFISNSTDCDGGNVEKYLGLLEASPTEVVKTPVYSCIRTSGKRMHIVTLKLVDCKTDYKVQHILGYTK